MLTATDKGTIRIVVIAVAALALACVGGVIALSIAEVTIPSTLEVTTGVAVGGLVGLLSSTRSGAGGQEAAQAAALAQTVAQPLPQPASSAGAVAPIVVNLDTVPETTAPTAGVADPGPVDMTLLGAEYQHGPPDQPSAAALAAQTMGEPPTVEV